MFFVNHRTSLLQGSASATRSYWPMLALSLLVVIWLSPPASGQTITGSISGVVIDPNGSNKLSMTINQDAVAEVKVLRNNYAAEYGNNGGALINLVSKGGGKDYRGSVYYFVRNESLNANNFFSNKAALARPLYRHKVPGINFGGPEVGVRETMKKFAELRDMGWLDMSDLETEFSAT